MQKNLLTIMIQKKTGLPNSVYISEFPTYKPIISLYRPFFTHEGHENKDYSYNRIS